MYEWVTAPEIPRAGLPLATRGQCSCLGVAWVNVIKWACELPSSSLGALSPHPSVTSITLMDPTAKKLETGHTASAPIPKPPCFTLGQQHTPCYATPGPFPGAHLFAPGPITCAQATSSPKVGPTTCPGSLVTHSAWNPKMSPSSTGPNNTRKRTLSTPEARGRPLVI
jgi:hypothetical protein